MFCSHPTQTWEDEEKEYDEEKYDEEDEPRACCGAVPFCPYGGNMLHHCFPAAGATGRTDSQACLEYSLDEGHCVCRHALLGKLALPRVRNGSHLVEVGAAGQQSALI